MTVGMLRKLLKLADSTSAPDDMRIVTHGDYLHHEKRGVYALPERTCVVYICCAMGGCSWRESPAPFFKPAIFWDGR